MASRNPEEKQEGAVGGGGGEGESGGGGSRVTADVVSRALGVDMEQLAAQVNSPQGAARAAASGVDAAPARGREEGRVAQSRASSERRAPQPRAPRPRAADREGVRPAAGELSLDEFLERNKLVLGRGRRELARALYNLTYARGETECFTGYTELARESGRTKRRCQDLLSELHKLGFVEFGETVNTAEKKGRVIKFFLTPRVRAV